MGCCPSSGNGDVSMSEKESIGSKDGIQLPPHQYQAKGNNKKDKKNGKEEHIEQIFKAKRANVFSEGIDDNERSTYRPKKISKTAKQAETIRKSQSSLSLSKTCLIYHFSRKCLVANLYLQQCPRIRYHHLGGIHGNS
jgi:hypothetical protein